jgi:hypothetical protein
MEPGEALGIAAQIAVTLAGFAGVVVVFRREAVHQWSALDKFRLRLLLGNSVLPLCLCAVALVLLTIEPVPTGVWKWCRRGLRGFLVLRDHDDAALSAPGSPAATRQTRHLHFHFVLHLWHRSNAVAVVQRRRAWRVLAI